MGTLPRDAVLEISYTPVEKETSRQCPFALLPLKPTRDTGLLKLDLSIKALLFEKYTIKELGGIIYTTQNEETYFNKGIELFKTR